MKRAVKLGFLNLLAVAACSSSHDPDGSGGATSSTTGASTTASSTAAATSSTTVGASSSSGTGGAPACPACVTLATLPTGSQPCGLFVDDANVYFTNLGTGEVVQMKNDGTGKIELATAEDSPVAVFVAAGSVYWISYSVGSILRKTPIGGGAITDLNEAPAARELFVGTDWIWWTREPDDVQRVPIGGSPTPDLLTLNTLSNGLTADATSIYWVNRQDGYIKKGAYDLTNETPLGIGDVPWDIAVDDTNVYWTEEGSAPNTGRVVQASKADGSGVIELASMQSGPAGIAIDANNVYWANRDEGTINEAPIGGGTVKVLAAGQELPYNVATDATHVYFTNLVGGTVVKVPK